MCIVGAVGIKRVYGSVPENAEGRGMLPVAIFTQDQLDAVIGHMEFFDPPVCFLPRCDEIYLAGIELLSVKRHETSRLVTVGCAGRVGDEFRLNQARKPLQFTSSQGLSKSSQVKIP